MRTTRTRSTYTISMRTDKVLVRKTQRQNHKASHKTQDTKESTCIVRGTRYESTGSI